MLLGQGAVAAGDEAEVPEERVRRLGGNRELVEELTTGDLGASGLPLVARSRVDFLPRPDLTELNASRASPMRAGERFCAMYTCRMRAHAKLKRTRGGFGSSS